MYIVGHHAPDDLYLVVHHASDGAKATAMGRTAGMTDQYDGMWLMMMSLVKRLADG